MFNYYFVNFLLMSLCTVICSCCFVSVFECIFVYCSLIVGVHVCLSVLVYACHCDGKC